MIVPVHGHPVHIGGPKLFDHYDEYVSALNGAGIDKMVIWGNDFFGVDNTLIVNFVHKYPDRFMGAPQISPFDPQALDKMKKLADEHGMSGIKLHPAEGFYLNDKKVMYPIYEQALELHMYNIAVHCAVAGGSRPKASNIYCQPLTLDEPSRDFPSINFQLSHCGWPLLEQTIMLQERKNIYLDISYIRVFENVWEEKVRLLLIAFGPERLLFGNYENFAKEPDRDFDYAYDIKKTAQLLKARTDQTIRLLDNLKVSKEDQAKIMGGTALHLYRYNATRVPVINN